MKTSYNKKMAKKLVASEANPPRIKKYAQDTTSPQMQKLLTVGIVSVLVAIIGVFIWMQINNVVTTEKDHNKFTQLQKNITTEGNLLKDVAPNLTYWKQQSSCDYTPGTFTSDGGWNCGSGWNGSLLIKDLPEAYAMAAQFESSPLYSLKSKADLSDLLKPESISNSLVSFSSYGYDKDTGVLCGVGFKSLGGNDISVGFGCSDSAKASWYPNTEPKELHAPGQDAYKQ